MRLTAQVISTAPIFINPEGKLTLQLRNLHIPYIENLGITQDKYAVIDLSNNELLELGGIPSNFHNLEVLLLANNFITKISSSFPSENQITSISLINNNINSFENFNKFSNLTSLSLLNNPITTLSNYRLFIIWLIPSLKVLDFAKVKPAEREAAISLFGQDLDNSSPQALSMLGNKSLQHTEKIPHVQAVVKKLTVEERKVLLEKLRLAESIDEITDIENTLKNGQV